MSQSDPAPKPAFDPFELWKQFYEANEQAWTKTLKEMTTTQDYAEAQGKMLESMLAFQKTMRDSMSAQLSSLNLPTRDDVSRLGELILSLEEKIDQLDDRMPALEKRLGAVEKKVDGLADLEKAIEAVGNRIAGISQRLPERVAREVQETQEEEEATREAARPARPGGARPRSEKK